MRYAIFSDIHGNRQAWEAVLADMEASSVHVYVCLGDVVGYGPRPQEVLRGIRARTQNMVVGNHDAAAAGRIDTSLFNPVARKAIEWTRGQLDEESLAFLSAMPVGIATEELLFVHAEAVDPGRFGYIDDAATAQQNFAASNHRVTFVGHTHTPALFRLEEDGSVVQLPDQDCILEADRRYIVNVGSVGEPRDFDDIRARYVIYDADARGLYFRRIGFDPEAYRADLLASGLELKPFFLKIFDHQQAADEEAARTFAPGIAASGEAGWEIGVGMRDLVVPLGPNSAPSSTALPGPEPIPPRERRGARAVAILIPALAILMAVGAVVATWLRDQPADPENPAVNSIKPAGDAVAYQFVGPPVEASPGPAAEASEPLAGPRPGEAEESDPPAVAVVPAPAPAPDPPAPEPAPAPAPKFVKPPIPPEPENPAELLALPVGLVFYAPFDEDESALTADDMSSAGRHLDVASAMPGGLGQVGLACRLEKGGGAVTSEAKPLPELIAITISFWIRLPKPTAEEKPAEEPPPDEKPAEEKPAEVKPAEVKPAEVKPADENPADPPPPAPPVNLVSIKDYCEVRLENNQVVANLDRAGEETRVALPQDSEWHHVLAENGEGITTLWIDHLSTADPTSESLPAVPPGPVAVQIGATEADFFIDEVAIWDRKFTPGERQNLYRCGRLGSPILTPTEVIAHWGFDDGKGTRVFADAAGRHPLGAYRGWRQVKGIAPDPVPLNLKANAFGAQVWHVAERPDEGGSFQMKPDAAFTYEGWVKLGANTAGILGGTTAGGDEKGGSGWRLAAVRDKSGHGLLAFIYENGSEKVQALGKDLPLYDGLPHHFAAIWNPMDSPTHGKMLLYLDNAEVATASLALSNLAPLSGTPFRIAVKQNAIILDELRFSSGVLKPDSFLTGGSSAFAADKADNPIPRGESILRRRDREARERKKK